MSSPNTESQLLESIVEKLDEITICQRRFQARLDILEEVRLENLEEATPLQARAPTIRPESGPPSPAVAATAGASAPGASDVQGEFKALQDSLSRVKLPSNLRLNEGRQGIRRSDQPLLNVITRCARYTEAILKLLSSTDEQVDLDAVNFAAYSQIKYLQDEYAALVVNNTFDPTTSRLFRAMQRNTTGLSSDAQETLKQAASLAAVSRPTREAGGYTNNSNNTGYNNFGGFYRGRGRGNRGSRGRGRPDIFHGFSSSSPFPPRRSWTPSQTDTPTMPSDGQGHSGGI